MNPKKTSERIEAASLEFDAIMLLAKSSWSMIKKKKATAISMAKKHKLDETFLIKILSGGSTWDVKEELIRKK